MEKNLKLLPIVKGSMSLAMPVEVILAPMRTEKVTERTEGLAISQPLDVKMVEVATRRTLPRHQ
jgi:hypothetical protein